MEKILHLHEQLSPWHAVQLEASRRGSGLNAVWKIQLPDRPAVLKTFARRRSWLKTFLTGCDNLLTRRTSYSSGGRCRTEASNLGLWLEAGFDVPHLLPRPPGLQMRLKCLCMEYLDGVLLSAFLANDTVPQAERDAVFDRFLKTWAARHALADQRRDPRLIQEHGTFEHVMLAGERMVTFDLEVSFRRSRSVRDCLVDEICGYLRSLFRLLPLPLAWHYFDRVVAAYPRRDFLEEVPRRLLRNTGLVSRTVHSLDRRLLRNPAHWHKYRIAEQLETALSPGVAAQPPGASAA